MLRSNQLSYTTKRPILYINFLLVGKNCRTFVDEGVHAFLLVLGGEQRMEQAALEHDAIAQARLTDSLAAMTAICEKPQMVMAAPRASSIILS